MEEELKLNDLTVQAIQDRVNWKKLRNNNPTWVEKTAEEKEDLF